MSSIEFAICNIHNKSKDKITKKKYQLQVITNDKTDNTGTDFASLGNIHVTCNKPSSVLRLNAAQQTECLTYRVITHRSQQTIDLSHNFNEFIENIIIENEFTESDLLENDNFTENITIEYLIATFLVFMSLVGKISIFKDISILVFLIV